MKQTNAFDDLARRKLEERVFPYDEANWLEVQRALDAQRRRRKGLFWSLAAGLLLLLGLGTWWRISVQPDAAPTAHVAPAHTPQANAPATSQAAEPATTEPAAASQVPTSAEGSAVHATTSTSAQPVRTNTTNTTTSKPVDPAVAPVRTNNPSAMAKQGTERPSPASNSVEPAVVIPATNLAAPMPPAVNVASSGTTPPPVEPPAVPAASTTPPSGDDVVPAIGITAAPPATTATSATDSTLATNTFVQDSIMAPPALPPTAPVNPGLPWEITALGGMLASNSTFSGGTSADWSGSLSGEQAPAFGVEGMRMGDHFGYGSGLHYTTYAERFTQPDLYTTATNYQNVYFLTQVDTTVMLITDTILQQGQIYYVTTPITTTLTVLDWTTDTVHTTVRTQQARDQVNSLSYLEVPLLGDVHTAKGKWQFGLRAGPTIGLLTGRRGSVPDSQMDGLTDYADQPFRSYAFGYVARAYVRFRVCTAWSVGIEPTLRGHLTDAYQDYTLSRSSTGVGAMLSLSYRLP